MLKDSKDTAEIYDEAKGMANLKKIQSIKQKVVEKENLVGHSFDALAKIKESSDAVDKFFLWDVKVSSIADITAVFRSSKERVDAEHHRVKGMTTINLSVQHPVLKECVTIASMDCISALFEFWKKLNNVLVYLGTVIR